MTAAPKIVVISAGLSSPSSTRMLADELSSAVASELRAGGSEPGIVVHELRALAQEITSALTSRLLGERVQALSDDIRTADAVIAVTPIFNMGPSGLFKTLIDVLDREIWRGKPVLLGATAGSARHSLALDLMVRPSFEFLKARVVPTIVFAASADFGQVDAAEADASPLVERAQRAARELVAILAVGQVEAGGRSAATDGHDSRGQATGGAGPSGDGPGDGDASADHPAAGLDPEFAEFTPMDQLLGARR